MFEPPYVGSYKGQVVDREVPIDDQHVPVNDQHVPIDDRNEQIVDRSVRWLIPAFRSTISTSRALTGTLGSAIEAYY